MKSYLLIAIILLSFLVGLIAGTGLGMQKGQYMLFEGLDKMFDGAEININLNETKMVEEVKKQIVPYMLEELKDANSLEEVKK